MCKVTKDDIFNELIELFWNHGVFKDSQGKSENGNYNSQEIQAHWDKYHELVKQYKATKK